MVKTQNIGTGQDTYVAGDSLRIDATVTEDGSAKDLEGATINFGVGEDYGSQLELQDSNSGVTTNITSAADGELEVVIDKGVTDDMPGYWVYEIEIEDASGQSVTVVRGDLEISNDLV